MPNRTVCVPNSYRTLSYFTVLYRIRIVLKIVLEPSYFPFSNSTIFCTRTVLFYVLELFYFPYSNRTFFGTIIVKCIKKIFKIIKNIFNSLKNFKRMNFDKSFGIYCIFIKYVLDKNPTRTLIKIKLLIIKIDNSLFIESKEFP